MATIIMGVKTLITFMIRSKSRKAVRITNTAHRALPAHTGRPNCCSKFAPAPASITKPIAKPEKTSTTSMTRRSAGWVMRSKTSSWWPDR